MGSVRQLAAPFLLTSPRLELSITNANRRSGLKAPLHWPIFRATFLSRNAMAKQVARNIAQCNKKGLRDKLQKPLRKVDASSTFVATNFSSIAQCNICPATCVATFAAPGDEIVPLTSSDHRKRDKLQETLP